MYFVVLYLLDLVYVVLHYHIGLPYDYILYDYLADFVVRAFRTHRSHEQAGQPSPAKIALDGLRLLW